MELNVWERDSGNIASWLMTKSDGIASVESRLDLVKSIIDFAYHQELILVPEFKWFHQGKTEVTSWEHIVSGDRVLDFDVFGNGVEYNRETGTRRLTSALVNFRYNMRLEDEFYIDVGTRTDIWLPYNLKGEQRTSLYVSNLGRLTRFLSFVKSLGFKVSDDDFYEETRFCIKSGFLLMNYPHRIIGSSEFSDEVAWEFIKLDLDS